MTLFNFDFGDFNFPLFRRKKKVVLVVDDDELTVRAIRYAAEANGFDVESAGTAEEALGILHHNGREFVIAMLDVNLPGMNGWKLHEAIHDLWPKLAVVVMSGAPESFYKMPVGVRLSVLIKPANLGKFFQDLR